MNWAEYLLAKQRLIGDSHPIGLMMAGIAFDNSTDFEQKGREIDNTYEEFFSGSYEDSDFVWLKPGKARVHFMSAGGHPALVGSDLPLCAGVVKNEWIFFHSGHYHPKENDVIFFMCDFIDTTCRNIHGGAKDEEVNKICNMKLTIYKNNSDTDTYDITFEQIAGIGLLPVPVIVKSSPHAPVMHGSVEYEEKKIPFVMSKESAITHHSLSLGMSLTGSRISSDIIKGHKRWVPDSEVTKCQSCKKTFGTFTRKHHCRQCGNIFCDACTKQKKIVKNPAVKSEKDMVDITPEKVRVCDVCFYSRQL